MPRAARTPSTDLGLCAALLLTLTLSAAQLTPLDEKTFADVIRSHHGKIVLIDFWATWCEPCREEMPRLVALAKRFPPAKFRLITVSADEPEQDAAVSAFLDKQGAAGPRYIKRTQDDERFINAIDKDWSGALPALFLYDSSGVRIASFISESNIHRVEAAIRKAIAGL